jgi:glyoxylate/hydroxypyruvate reductase A
LPATRIVLLSRNLDMSFLSPEFVAADPEVEVLVGVDAPGATDADVAVCWNPLPGDLSRLPRLRLIQSIAAGVDHILADPGLPTHATVCRVIDPGMAAGMSAYVLWAVIHQQRHFDRYLVSAAQREWREQPIRSPRNHRVGIAGFGWLGSGCARALQAVGYDVRGWSRTAARTVPPGIATFHGQAQREAFLAGCDTLVCMLPLTDDTRGFIGTPVLQALPHGAHLVHVGRGGHLVEADLLAALDSGRLASATLDTFAEEPLPRAHPFWTHPKIIVTPHIASRTDRSQIVRQTLDNLATVRQGRVPSAAIDPNRGY